MSRLTRYTQQIFGSTAGLNQMAEFGSLAASDPQLYSGSTITPAIIQTLSNYLSGWFGAVMGGNSPAIEDMNSLCYLFAYQLAYILQAGVPEWDSGTTYYTGDLVQSSGILYVSLSDTNLNNNPTSDTTHWFTPVQNGCLTPNTIPNSMTLPANQTLQWPNATIGSGVTVTVPSNAYMNSLNKIVLNGTGNLTISGTGVVRII